MSWDLSGRTVLVTGAARGIGESSARKLAGRGARVSLVGLEPDELGRVARACGEGRAAWFEADVTDAASLERAAAGTVERFGGIDAVVANAGIATAGMLRSSDPAAFERTIEVNLLGAFRTVRACLPELLERRGYAFIVASMAAVLQTPGLAAYAASKAGVEALAHSLRAELRPLGVDVGVGYFSWIDTDLVRGGDAHPAFGWVRERAPWPFTKTYPVELVGEAVADAVARRARRSLVPRWLAAVIALRGLLAPLADRGPAADVAREMDERFLVDVSRRGVEDASAPVGAGGAAARRGSANR